jgi:hypothetical protein
MNFKVGHLQFPEDNDKEYETFMEAIDAAVEGSWDDSVWAVWRMYNNGNADIESLVYQGVYYQ